MSNKETTTTPQEGLGGHGGVLESLGAVARANAGMVELGIDTRALGLPPVGAPVDFWELVARALKTTDPDVLRGAEATYRGVFESAHAYVVAQLAERMQPPDLAWLLACCDPDRLREGYEGRARVVWSIGLEDGGCVVFESMRARPEVLFVSLAVELDDDAQESACPVCGATDWMIVTQDGARGCDRCP